MITEISERITKGMSVSMTDDVGFEEPVSLSEVKLFISMDDSLSVHDNVLNSLNTACRRLVEDKLGVSLIPRSVVVSWREFYDFSKLPYLPVQPNETIAVTDLSGNVMDSDNYELRGVGGFLELVGDFGTGVKVSYKAGFESVSEAHKFMVKSMVRDVFVNQKSLKEALSNNVIALPI